MAASPRQRKADLSSGICLSWLMMLFLSRVGILLMDWISGALTIRKKRSPRTDGCSLALLWGCNRMTCSSCLSTSSPTPTLQWTVNPGCLFQPSGISKDRSRVWDEHRSSSCIYALEPRCWPCTWTSVLEPLSENLLVPLSFSLEAVFNHSKCNIPLDPSKSGKFFSFLLNQFFRVQAGFILLWDLLRLLTVEWQPN